MNFRLAQKLISISHQARTSETAVINQVIKASVGGVLYQFPKPLYQNP